MDESISGRILGLLKQLCDLQEALAQEGFDAATESKIRLGILRAFAALMRVEFDYDEAVHDVDKPSETAQEVAA